MTITHTTYGTRTLVFTVNGVLPGANGEPATVYSLLPDQSQIKVSRSGSGFIPSTVSLRCGYTKNNGGVMSTVADARSAIDGTYYIYHRKRLVSSGAFQQTYYKYGTYVESTSAGYTLTNIRLDLYDAVEFILCTVNVSSFAAVDLDPTTVIDRETVPVITDGQDGTNGTNGTNGQDGEDGEDAVIHEIECSPDTVNFRSDAVGEFSPSSKSITCIIKKTEGDSAPVTVSSGTDGLYLYYRKIGVPSDLWTAYTAAVSVTSREATQSSYTITAVEFCLSTVSEAQYVSSSITSSNSNIVKNKFVAVVCDGRIGSTGATGRMFYSMGTYTAGTTYVRTSELVPMVFYNNGVWNQALGIYGNYYYLADGKTGTNVTPGTDNTVWIPADSFGLVITQGIFAQFAKLGKAIMSGDFIFSMNGYIGDTQYQGGSNYGNRKAYTYFNGDPDLFCSKGTISSVPTSYTKGTYLLSVSLIAGQEILLEVAIADLTGNVTMAIFQASASTTTGTSNAIDMYVDDSSSASKSITFSSSTTKARIRLIAPSATTYEIRYKRLSSTDAQTSKPYTVSSFRPNWWVDLLTGKMSAARGNFVVKPDGSVDVANGKFTVDGDGNVVANDITIRGSLMCHDVLFAYSSVSQPTYPIYTAHYDVESAFTKMSLNADTIIVSGTYYSAGVNVELPPAMFFPGVRIKIMNATYETVNSQRRSKKCSVTISVAHNGDWKEDAWNVSLESLAVAVPFKTAPDSSSLLPFDYRTDVTYTTYSMVELVSTRNIYNSQTSSYYVWMIVDVNE